MAGPPVGHVQANSPTCCRCHTSALGSRTRAVQMLLFRAINRPSEMRILSLRSPQNLVPQTEGSLVGFYLGLSHLISVPYSCSSEGQLPIWPGQPFQIWPQLYCLYPAVILFPLSCPYMKHKSSGLLLSEERLTLSVWIPLLLPTGCIVVPLLASC